MHTLVHVLSILCRTVGTRAVCTVLYRTGPCCTVLIIMLRAIQAMFCCLHMQCMSNNKWHSCTVQAIWVTFRLFSLWHHPSTSRALYIVATTAQRLLWMSHVSSMIRMHVCLSVHLCPTQNDTFLRSIYFVATTITHRSNTATLCGPLLRVCSLCASLGVFTLLTRLSYLYVYIMIRHNFFPPTL